MMRMTIMDISVEWLIYNLDFIKIEREIAKSLLEINEKDKGMNGVQGQHHDCNGHVF